MPDKQGQTSGGDLNVQVTADGGVPAATASKLGETVRKAVLSAISTSDVAADFRVVHLEGTDPEIHPADSPLQDPIYGVFVQVNF